MSGPNGIERRDPCKPVLLLGSALTKAQRSKLSGAIELWTPRESHNIILNSGKVEQVVGPNGPLEHEEASRIFSIPRPLLKWNEKSDIFPCQTKSVHPSHLLVEGITARKDIFEPTQFVERVPVSTLQIDYHNYVALKKLPFKPHELSFFKGLSRPTPIAMILWKRGLEPQYAASLLTTLNLLGVFKDVWKPGFLPRLSLAQKILKKKAGDASDYQLLGVHEVSTSRDIDKAFRKLSFELHPDRTVHQSKEEQQLSNLAFKVICDAKERLKRQEVTRRKRPVSNVDASLWQGALTAAEEALLKGNILLTKKYALNCLSKRPPSFVTARLKTILAAAA